eukprot:1638624-Rhodomonas_salina.1
MPRNRMQRVCAKRAMQRSARQDELRAVCVCAGRWQAHFMLLTVRGIPCIYYGDECRVPGRKEEGDAALRMPMVKPADVEGGQQLYDMIAGLIKLRQQHECLVRGWQSTLYHQNNEVSSSRSFFLSRPAWPRPTLCRPCAPVSLSAMLSCEAMLSCTLSC